MSEGQCESQQASVVPDSVEHGSSSDRENNPNSLTPSSDMDLSPSIEELIERIKILALETPRPLNSKLPRAPFPTPAKASPDGRTIVDNSSSSSFTEDGQESTQLGLKRLKKAIERRLGGRRFASPGRSSKHGSKHAADAVDNKLLAVMLATEHQRRQRMEWDLEVEERSSDDQVPIPPFDHHQFDSSIFSPRTRSVVSDASVHVTKGSSCSEIDTSSELEKFQHEGDLALSLEYSLREVSEVFSVFVKCNKWMLRSRVDASPVERALDKRDLVGADIFRQAIDISFGEVVTREQKQWIYDSYMRTIDTSQGQLEEVACDDSPILLEGSKEDDDKQRDEEEEEEGIESATNEGEKMVGKVEVMRCACFRARLSLLKFNKREESKEEEEEKVDDYPDETRGREGEKEDLDEIFFGGGERRLAKKEGMKSRGRRKWRSLSEYENESSSTPINEESGKRRTFSESDVLNASLFISDDFLSEDYIRKLERSVSLVNEISSNVSEDLAKSDTSAKFPKEEEEEVEEEVEEASFNSDDVLAKCSRRKSSRSTSSADSVGRRSDISDKTRKFQLNLREMEAEDEQESLPDSTKCTMDSNSVHSDNLSLDLDDVYDTFQRSERILASCLADTENRRGDRRIEIGEFGSLSDSVYFTPPADDQASPEDKLATAELVHVSTDSTRETSSVSKETDTSRVKECEDDDVFEDVGTMKPCEKRNSFHSFLNRILFKQTRYGTMKGSPNESRILNEDENKNTLKQNIVDGEKISKTRCGGRRTVTERCRPGNCLSG